MISSGSSDNSRTRPPISPPPTWKLYDNPHYSLSRPHNSKSRSVFFASRSFMETHRHVNLSDLDKALAKMKELRSQLDSESQMRRKAEATTKTLTREKEAAEEKCRKLTVEMACTTREEGQKEKAVEDKIKETSSTSNSSTIVNKINCDAVMVKKKEVENPHIKRGIKGMEFPRAVLRSRGGGGGGRGGGSNGVTGSLPSSREGSSGSEVGSSMSSNLECQRAQLRVLMRHKSSTSPTSVFHNNLIM